MSTTSPIDLGPVEPNANASASLSSSSSLLPSSSSSSSPASSSSSSPLASSSTTPLASSSSSSSSISSTSTTTIPPSSSSSSPPSPSTTPSSASSAATSTTSSTSDSTTSSDSAPGATSTTSEPVPVPSTTDAPSFQTSVVEQTSTIGTGSTASVVRLTRTFTESSPSRSASPATSSLAISSSQNPGGGGSGGLSGLAKTIAIALPCALGGIVILVGLFQLFKWFRQRRQAAHDTDDIVWPEVIASPNEAKSLYPQPTHAGAGHGIGADREDMLDRANSTSMTVSSAYGSSVGRVTSSNAAAAGGGFGAMGSMSAVGYGNFDVGDNYSEGYSSSQPHGYVQTMLQPYNNGATYDQNVYSTGQHYTPDAAPSSSGHPDPHYQPSQPSHPVYPQDPWPAAGQYTSAHAYANPNPNAPDTTTTTMSTALGSETETNGLGYSSHHNQQRDSEARDGLRDIQFTTLAASQDPYERGPYKLAVHNPDG